MTYLLDANVLIQAHEDYYPVDRVRPFWDWLLAEAVAGHAKMPFEVYEEIASGNGLLRDWITDAIVRDALVLDEQVDAGALNRVLETAYGPRPNAAELEEAGRDPFLVAYGLAQAGRIVVTKEVSKPTKTRGRRKVPDACNDVGVPWVTDFAFYRARNFRI